MPFDCHAFKAGELHHDPGQVVNIQLAIKPDDALREPYEWQWGSASQKKPNEASLSRQSSLKWGDVSPNTSMETNPSSSTQTGDDFLQGFVLCERCGSRFPDAERREASVVIFEAAKCQVDDIMLAA